MFKPLFLYCAGSWQAYQPVKQPTTVQQVMRVRASGCQQSNGIFYTVKATIDSVGRLVVPKPIREAAHLQPGTQVQFRLVDDHVEIEPVPLSLTLDRSGTLVVAVPRKDGAVLTKSDVDETIAEIRSGADSGRPS